MVRQARFQQRTGITGQSSAAPLGAPLSAPSQALAQVGSVLVEHQQRMNRVQQETQITEIQNNLNLELANIGEQVENKTITIEQAQEFTDGAYSTARNSITWEQVQDRLTPTLDFNQAVSQRALRTEHKRQLVEHGQNELQKFIDEGTQAFIAPNMSIAADGFDAIQNMRLGKLSAMKERYFNAAAAGMIPADKIDSGWDRIEDNLWQQALQDDIRKDPKRAQELFNNGFYKFDAGELAEMGEFVDRAVEKQIRTDQDAAYYEEYRRVVRGEKDGIPALTYLDQVFDGDLVSEQQALQLFNVLQTRQVKAAAGLSLLQDAQRRMDNQLQLSAKESELIYIDRVRSATVSEGELSPERKMRILLSTIRDTKALPTIAEDILVSASVSDEFNQSMEGVAFYNEIKAEFPNALEQLPGDVRADYQLLRNMINLNRGVKEPNNQKAFAEYSRIKALDFSETEKDALEDTARTTEFQEESLAFLQDVFPGDVEEDDHVVFLYQAAVKNLYKAVGHPNRQLAFQLAADGIKNTWAPSAYGGNERIVERPIEASVARAFSPGIATKNAVDAIAPVLGGQVAGDGFTREIGVNGKLKLVPVSELSETLGRAFRRGVGALGAFDSSDPQFLSSLLRIHPTFETKNRIAPQVPDYGVNIFKNGVYTPIVFADGTPYIVNIDDLVNGEQGIRKHLLEKPRKAHDIKIQSDAAFEDAFKDMIGSGGIGALRLGIQ